MKKNILTLKKILYAVFISFLSVSCSDRDKIIKAYDSGNFILAQDLCKPKAEKNDPKCLYLLGKIAIEGDGTVQNLDEGVKYLKQAADLGHRYAKLNYGMMALNGTFNLPAEEAVKYVYEAAKAGLPEAQLGYYTYISGSKSDKLKEISEGQEKEANAFLKSAADKGNKNAMEILAVSYCIPISTQPECGELGIPMLEKAAMTDDGFYSNKVLGIIRYSRNEFDKSIEPLKKAALIGDGESAFYLGRIYIAGKGFEEGYKWVKLAAEKGNPDAKKQMEAFKGSDLGKIVSEGEVLYKQLIKIVNYNKMVLKRKAEKKDIRKEFLDKV